MIRRDGAEKKQIYNYSNLYLGSEKCVSQSYFKYLLEALLLLPFFTLITFYYIYINFEWKFLSKINTQKNLQKNSSRYSRGGILSYLCIKSQGELI